MHVHVMMNGRRAGEERRTWRGECREKRTGDMILMAVHGDGFDGVGKSNRSPHHPEAS